MTTNRLAKRLAKTKGEWVQRYKNQLMSRWKFDEERAHLWVKESGWEGGMDDRAFQNFYSKVNPEHYADDDYQYGD